MMIKEVYLTDHNDDQRSPLYRTDHNDDQGSLLYLTDGILQLCNLFERCGLGIGVIQKSLNIYPVINVSIHLDVQSVALSVTQFLWKHKQISSGQSRYIFTTLTFRLDKPFTCVY